MQGGHQHQGGNKLGPHLPAIRGACVSSVCSEAASAPTNRRLVISASGTVPDELVVAGAVVAATAVAAPMLCQYLVGGSLLLFGAKHAPLTHP